MNESDRSLGRLEGKMDILNETTASYHLEAQAARQRMFQELDRQGRNQAAQAEKIAQIEREVGPMKKALDDYQRMRARAGGIIATVLVVATVAGTVLAHALSLVVTWLKRAF